jgi:hypothetical protein
MENDRRPLCSQAQKTTGLPPTKIKVATRPGTAQTAWIRSPVRPVNLIVSFVPGDAAKDKQTKPAGYLAHIRA